jgi:hypothetical protein
VSFSSSSTWLNCCDESNVEAMENTEKMKKSKQLGGK